MRLKRTIMTPLLVAGLALASGGWFLQRGVGAERNVYANARLFEDVLRRVSEKFVDPKQPSELYRMAIDGMLEELGDPHSGFMPSDEYDQLRMQTEGEYGGIGVQISKRGDYVTVIAPLPGTPGERAGLRAGDAIVEVNDTSAKGWTDEMAVRKLRGPRGSKVNVAIARAGVDQPIRFTITREAIRISPVPSAYVMDGGVGYVDLTVFSESSTDSLRRAITRLRNDGARGIILDLRTNPGGLLEQGSAVADLFLPKGKLIVETKSRLADQNQRSVSVSDDQFPGMPMVVLVGPFSASASEIVAGALQDHDRALVLGRTTYGKGSVQTVFPLADNNWLKLTTARWYTPSGRSIQKEYGVGNGDHPAETAATDSSENLAERPTYRTSGGRTVYGGGGITPDLIVSPDSTVAEERAFLQQLQAHGSEYTTARLRYTVSFIDRNPGLEPSFTVTDAMLGEFYEALQRAGVSVPRTLYDEAKRWVAQDLGYEIAYSKWGQQAARRRSNELDAQVLTAARLLRSASTPEMLFTAARRQLPKESAAAATVQAEPGQR
ncbi:MAG TPA: S41 family peptidase [Longimicrobiales bacterium]|nr:S41 family peptidase [Longimicrobiales bacterium]